MANFVEELVAEYYKARGYLVSTNYWIPFNMPRRRVQRQMSQSYSAQSWTDIDVLARNSKELLIVQVKSSVNQAGAAEKIITYFERVDEFLMAGVSTDGYSNIEWWTKGVNVRRIVVYEDKWAPRAYLAILHNDGIETKFFGDYLDDIITYVQGRKGVKEQNAAMRLLHFCHKHKKLAELATLGK